MRGSGWNDESLVMLRGLWAAGATAQSIADRLGGISRSAVLGKIFRLRRGAAEVPPARRRSRKVAVAQDAAAAAPRRGKSLLELSNDTCRWPHGEPGTPRFFFCGAPGADLENGRPYCARHARRAFHVVAIRTENPNETADQEIQPTAAPMSAPASAPPRRYIWRAGVRHPAPRWR